MQSAKAKKTNKPLAERVRAVLQNGGTLEKAIPGYAPREAQIAMALEVVETIQQDSTLLAEAGTGTGKTFAYLIPALLSGKKIILSTATKTLQEQLIQKDLPMLMKACDIKSKARLLKGRDNYVCPQRLEIAETVEQHSREDWKKLAKIREWVDDKTLNGDRAELDSVAEDDPIWRKVSARMEFCQSAECSAEGGCFYPQVKQKAAEAEILVVNHHLFCADLALREQGFGELLPEADVYVFDEAHQLPDIAAQFLGFSLSRSQLEELVRDIKQAQSLEAPESKQLADLADKISEQLLAVNQALGKWEKRWTWTQLESETAFQQTFKRMLAVMDTVTDALKSVEERGKQLSAVHKRCKEYAVQLKEWQNSQSENNVRWIESSQARFRLFLTPLNVAAAFSRQREEIGGAWLFTSATLSVRGQFDYFAKRLGLDDAKSVNWASPFDYQTQGVIYHPIGLPEPRNPDYIKICLRAAWPLLKAADGRAFMLFTSHKAMQEARAILQTHWKGNLLVQGDLPKLTLLQRFKEANSAILLGTSSFWEGVDVKGDALKLVVIDRIPFAPPDDPIVQAREAYLKEKGLNGFVHFQLPEAVIAMKQGAGRLIRDLGDRGVLMLCDPRLSTKGYGNVIRDSLPDFPWVYEAGAALEVLTVTDQTVN
ncbi:ATP-dependent DNA helicase [Thiomicrorhabdus heinhorstiae]|uniref:ATP-dependent DNA helicase n=1 Tax=Thiomicrorhabdus heinhorstiae TaxID=2748010 RepID=A0ABS0BU17_9GAMM|nr:ATP-dependent DNA helicase [Thiomicrorhabdus heinhorstiae]MBF6056829.1 ATP-dependent DNA helicase [Thiomicrorhabdus heinhorstiae]